MKYKIIFLMIAWAFFYGVAVAGAAAHRKTVKTSDSSFANTQKEFKSESRKPFI